MPLEQIEERHRLASIAADSWYAKGVNPATIIYSARIFERHWRQGKLLELGPAEGVMTDLLAPHFEQMTLVDGSKQFCESLQSRYPKATVVNALFEEFSTADRFDTIVLGHVLEHVEDPVQILSIARACLSPGGVICAAVPNSRSLHRQAAVLMDLLPVESALNDSDRHHGHRRVYTPESFRHDFREAGLKIKVFGGYWIKPLSNSQLEAQWTAPMLDAFMELGERYPDIAAEVYVIAEN